tara:strand:- start:198 stop:593 length:396 start_codon:yes stop_codon:yes gene_type:complete
VQTYLKINSPYNKTMGVIINETITLANGLTVTNPYASVGENNTKVEKKVEENMSDETDPETGEVTTTTTSTTKYIIQTRFTMWVSPELRVSGSKDIGGIQVQVESDTPPTGNVYELLYNKLKTMKTCTDSI